MCRLPRKCGISILSSSSRYLVCARNNNLSSRCIQSRRIPSKRWARGEPPQPRLQCASVPPIATGDSRGDEGCNALESLGELAQSRELAGNCACSVAIAINYGRSLSVSAFRSLRNHSPPLPRFITESCLQILVHGP